MRIVCGILLLLFTAALWAEEVQPGQMTENGRRFLERLTQAAAEAPAGRALPPLRRNLLRSRVMPSVVTIADQSIRGSGFIAELWGVPVLITNAHVFAEMEKPVIMDTRQNRYNPIAALISKSRDIAVMEIELPPDILPLTLRSRVEELPLQSRVYAYGDSQGGGVVVEKAGLLQGIGGQQLQISCEIVPGNSGGPVVAESGEVIGISTAYSVERDIAAFLRELENPVKPKDKKPLPMLVRRFALRLDDLDPAEFEIFDPVLQKRDLEIYRKLSRINSFFYRDLSKQTTYDGAQRLFFREYSQTDFRWGMSTSLRYLEPMLRSVRENSCHIAASVGMPMPVINQTQVRQAAYLYRQVVKGYRSRFQCVPCNGIGTVTKYQFDEFPESVACPACAGIAEKNVPFFHYPNHRPLGNARPRFYKPHPKLPALGVESAVALRMLLPDKPQTRDQINGIFEYWTFPGNPAFSRAIESRMGFVADRLSAISLRFECSQNSWDMLCRELTGLCGKPTVQFGEYGTWGYILWQKAGYTAALSLTSDNSDDDFIQLSLRHNVLTQLEFRLREELAGQYLVIPKSRRPDDPRVEQPQRAIKPLRPHSNTKNLFF